MNEVEKNKQIPKKMIDFINLVCKKRFVKYTINYFTAIFVPHFF